MSISNDRESACIKQGEICVKLNNIKVPIRNKRKIRRLLHNTQSYLPVFDCTTTELVNLSLNEYRFYSSLNGNYYYYSILSNKVSIDDTYIKLIDEWKKEANDVINNVGIQAISEGYESITVSKDGYIFTPSRKKLGKLELIKGSFDLLQQLLNQDKDNIMTNIDKNKQEITISWE